MRKAVTIMMTAALAVTLTAAAQVAPTSVGTSANISVSGGSRDYVLTAHPASVNTVIPSGNYRMQYNNNSNLRIVDFVTGGYNYINFATFDTVIMRRAANTWVNNTGNKQHIYAEGPNVLDNSGLVLPMPVAYPASASQSFMHRAIREGFINRGSDNVFNNDSTSDLTYNNIERIDFVYRNGVASLDIAKAGFLITERGGNDPFKISAITGIDASGNPTSFGPVLAVSSAAYGSPIANMFTYVLRKDAADSDIRLFSKVPNQSVRAVFINFQSLNVAPLQRIYGYALMGNDVTATTGAQVLDFTNTTYFPRNTNNANGGMDLASAPGIFHTNMVLAANTFELKAVTQHCSTQLQWSNPDYRQVKEYVIEKSEDQAVFEAIATTTPDREVQSFVNHRINGAGFYRIKIITTTGEIRYSSTVRTGNACGGTAISVYPNPASGTIYVNGGKSTIGSISIQSFNGMVLFSRSFSAGTGFVTLDISALKPGQYMLVTTGENQQRNAVKFNKH